MRAIGRTVLPLITNPDGVRPLRPEGNNRVPAGEPPASLAAPLFRGGAQTLRPGRFLIITIVLYETGFVGFWLAKLE